MGIFKKHFRGTDPIQPIVRTLGMIGKLKLEGLKTLANMENEKELSGKKEFKVGEVLIEIDGMKFIVEPEKED